MPGSGGEAIPVRPTPPTTAAPVVTTPDGAPEVLAFDGPDEFWCLVTEPAEAQVTLGWTVLSATEVTVTLDGVVLPSGIQPQAPFQVPVGDASGIGSTVRFACEPAVDHVITVSWRMGSSPPVERTVAITKGAGT